MPKPDEFAYQKAMVIWLRGNPGRDGVPRVAPALAPGVKFWHTPNGGERRDAFEGKRLKELGVWAGVHDLLFLRPTRFTEGTFGLLFGQEWKRPDAKKIPLQKRSPLHLELRAQAIANGWAPARIVDALSDSQLEAHRDLMVAGMAATVVVDNLDEAKTWCRAHFLAI
jgi:hypothetical protein